MTKNHCLRLTSGRIEADIGSIAGLGVGLGVVGFVIVWCFLLNGLERRRQARARRAITAIMAVQASLGAAMLVASLVSWDEAGGAFGGALIAALSIGAVMCLCTKETRAFASR